jgi:hypothetical protein
LGDTGSGPGNGLPHGADARSQKMPQKHLQISIQYLYNKGHEIANEIFVKLDFLKNM